eukprot:1143324-Pelagomonas_calceolata.AAC.3
MFVLVAGSLTEVLLTLKPVTAVPKDVQRERESFSTGGAHPNPAPQLNTRLSLNTVLAARLLACTAAHDLLHLYIRCIPHNTSGAKLLHAQTANALTANA